MRQILAVLNHLETSRAVLIAADLAAARLHATGIDVLHVRPASDPAFLPTEEVMTADRKARFEQATQARSAALRAAFEAWRAARAPGPVAAWREDIGVEADVVATRGDNADLIVIGRAARNEPGDGKAAIEAALFRSRAPVLLIPEAAPVSIGAHVAVAWKASATAGRAILAAAPLLRAAGRVTILIGEEPDGERPIPDELLSVIGASGRAPAPHHFKLAGRSAGVALMAEAHRVGADAMVMGAYADRRLLELLIGGATRDVLAHVDLPIFLHH
jgi:nucleotide-binding universal stress UspA family protein